MFDLTRSQVDGLEFLLGKIIDLFSIIFQSCMPNFKWLEVGIKIWIFFFGEKSHVGKWRFLFCHRRLHGHFHAEISLRLLVSTSQFPLSYWHDLLVIRLLLQLTNKPIPNGRKTNLNPTINFTTNQILRSKLLAVLTA